MPTSDRVIATALTELIAQEGLCKFGPDAVSWPSRSSRSVLQLLTSFYWPSAQALVPGICKGYLAQECEGFLRGDAAVAVNCPGWQQAGPAAAGGKESETLRF